MPAHRSLLASAASLLLLGLALGPGAPAVALQTNGGDGGWMRQHDANRDGRIQREEAPPAVARAFDRLDGDRDGSLSVQELLRGREAAQSRRQGGDERASAAPVSTPAVDDDIDGPVRSLITAEGLSGAAVIVRRLDTGDDVVRRFYGDYTADTRVPIASATKWFTGVAVAAAAEQSGRSLDEPIADCVPGLPADRVAITVRQTLSHVSGLPSLGPAAERGFPDLAASAASLLAQPAVDRPGAAFVYSGSAMQVASRCAEVYVGKDFRTLFADLVTGPLGLTETGFAPGGAPVTGGGLWSTPRDLERFTAMIAGRGVIDGKRVLSPTSFSDVTRLVSPAGARIVAIPDPARPFAGMATGMWCERATPTGDCVAVSSVGAFGTYAWVDRDAGLYGVFVVQSRLSAVWPTWRALRTALETR